MPQAQTFSNVTPIQATQPQSFTDVTPIGEQPQGFLSTLWSDIKNIRPSAQNPYPGMGQDEKTAAATAEAQRDQSRQAAGYSAPYRFVAPVAESVGVNVPGMEESARQGDTAGVLGHAAAVPVTYAATRALGAGGETALENAKPAWRMVGKAATAVGDSLDPDVVGLVSPRAAHALRLSSKVGRVASKFGAEPPVYPGAPLPEAPPVYPGAPLPDTPGVFPGAPLPETPPAEVLQAQPIAAGGQPTAPSPAAALGKIPAPWRMKPLPEGFQPAGPQYEPPIGTVDNPGPGPAPWRMKPQADALGEVSTPATQPAAQTGEALSQVPIAPWKMKPQSAALGDTPAPATARQFTNKVGPMIDEGLGNPPAAKPAVNPGQPIYRRTAASVPPVPAEGSVPAGNIPEGHTPVEGSSAVKSFKYDSDAQELHIAPTKGYTYVYGDVSPDQATQFQNADSTGKAWGEIRNSNPLVAKIHENGTRVAMKPSAAASGDDLTGVLQQSVDAAQKAKWKMRPAQ